MGYGAKSYHNGGDQMEIELQGKVRNIETNKKIRVKDLYKMLGLSPEEYLILKDKKLLTHDKYVSPEDKLKIVKVVSGG